MAESRATGLLRILMVSSRMTAVRRRISRLGREQLVEYPTVKWIDGHAEHAAKTVDGFVVDVDGQQHAAGNVALAVGDGALAGAATHRSLTFGLN